ncbi:hypothetical protein N7468_005896 [Penicillium chermesinum]|uniref:Rhodopsin domain-containing protein n=1 Tax=Penicillium chermesinum TaxID=63820 RepID=A0A9W9P0B1_9EURO|nr:uncharacterized protein N7468_005896 [Penicillium chermesinum]KAJ5232940.1 hypothetical protein N7468_005896 [Penicillium chermesinum]
MGAYGGRGPMVNGVLWAEAVIFAFFVSLRLFTRKVILNSVGADDWISIICLLVHILYTIFVTIATGYGLGRLYEDVGDAATYVIAVKYEIFSQVAGLMAIGIGKWAVGTFLLRIVRNKYQIAMIWACLAIVSIITVFASVTVVVQCVPVGYTVGSIFVAADFSFAILPWFVVWDLNMKQKEKILVASGLSLGIFAGVCGIVRTVALTGLSMNEYIYDTVPMLIWSATESTATIMCSTIPVLRPLYVRIRYNKKDGKSDPSSENNAYKIPLYPERYGKNVIACSTTNASDEAIIRDDTGITVTEHVSVRRDSFGGV